MKFIFLGLAMAVMASMSACGGGSPDASPKASPSSAQQQTNGTYTIQSTSVSPNPAMASEEITVAVNASFSGTIIPSPANDGFPVQFKVSKDGVVVKTGTINMVRDGGGSGVGTYSGSGEVKLPAQSPGMQTFSVQLDPAAAYAVAQSAPTMSHASAMVYPGADSGQVSRKNTAVFMGDSIVDNGSNTLNGLRNNRNILLHALRKLGQPIKVVAQAGYSGKRTDEIFNQWDAVVTPHDPGIVFWESGVNDFNHLDSPDVVFERLRAVHARAKAEGRRFIYIGMPPLYYNGLAASFLQRVRQLAREDSTFEYTAGSERLLEYNGTPSELGTPVFLTNAIPDGTHPSAYGADLWANQIVDYFQRRGTPFSNPFSTAGNSGAENSAEYLNNLLVNGLVGSAGAGWSSSVSTPLSRSSTITVEATGGSGLQAIVPGRLYKTVWTPAVNPSDQDVMSAALATDNHSSARRFAGRTFVARCYAKVSAVGGKLHDVHLRAIGYDWSYANVLFNEMDNKAFDMTSLPTWSMGVSSYEGVFETAPFTLPPTWNSPTQAHFLGYLNVSAAPGATVTVQVGAMEIVEVFTLR